VISSNKPFLTWLLSSLLFLQQAEDFILSLGAMSLPSFALFHQTTLLSIISLDNNNSLSSILTQFSSLLSSPSSSSSHPSRLFKTFLQNYAGPSLRLFISGDRSSVGKSTSCQYLLASFLSLGFLSSSLAYIKPVTQCEADQPVIQFCAEQGIACCGIGPVVFYQGFTRAYLNQTTDTSEELLAKVHEAVEEISRGKLIVLIDGVGYPAVGSICGISNGDTAKVLNAPVILVSKSGVGDAVDSFNLNAW
jgi:hypothetical protein